MHSYFSLLLIFSLLLLVQRPALGQGDVIGCNLPGECQEASVIGVSHQDSVQECQQFCQDQAGCLVYTYYLSDKVRRYIIIFSNMIYLAQCC